MRVLLPLSKNSNSTGEEGEEEEDYELEYYYSEESSSELEVEEQEEEGTAAAPTTAIVVAPATFTVAEQPSCLLPAQESIIVIPAVSSSVSESPIAQTDSVVFSSSSSSSSSSSPAITAPPVTQNRSTHSYSTKFPPPVQHLPNEQAEQKLPGVCSLKRKEPSPSEIKPAAAALLRITAPTPTDYSAATTKTGQEAVLSITDKRHQTRTENKKRVSRHINSHSTNDDRLCKKKKPPPSASTSSPTVGPATAAAAALPSSSSTSTTSSAATAAASVEINSTAHNTIISTKMTAPRNYKDDEEEDEHEQVRDNNNGGYYVEENEPPPVYDPNPVPSVARAPVVVAASSSHAAAAAAAVAGPVVSGSSGNARCHLVSHQNYNRKMSGSKKAAHDGPPPPPAAASMPQDPTNDNGIDDAAAAFCAALKRQGLEVVIQEGDGNCLFRAVSLQVYGESHMHGQVREQCLDFMEANGDHFGQFVTGEAFGDYIKRKRRLGVHGNNPEIQAISELFNRPVEVYEDADVNLAAKKNSQGHLVPMNIFQTGYKTSDAPIRLSYHDGNHYNAVIDPLLPTAGLGLGLPGLRPGLADQLQVASAKVESDHTMDLERAVKESREEQLKGQEDELQRALKESSYSMDTMYQHKAMALSDMDATNFELEQAAVESSLQTWLQTEHGRKKRASPVAGVRSRRRQQQQQPPPSQQQPPSPPSRASLSSTDDSTDDPTSLAHSVASSVARSAAACASVASVASAAAAPAAAAASLGLSSDDAATSADEYPFVVQELVMNGFELSKVVRAYELVGDNFDDLLSFLMSNTS